MSLVADYGDSSHGSSDEDSADSDYGNNFEKVDEGGSNERLPPPKFSNKVKNSVFLNPFLEAENAQYAVLEKHVKMVPQNNCKGAKKVCYMFKKGNCRYGKKCKFSHGAEETPLGNGNIALTIQENTQSSQQISEFPSDSPNEMKESEVKNKKRRPGLTQGLTPSKRVMTMYKTQKEEGTK